MTNIATVVATLARVLIQFQDAYLATWPLQGLLCQTWMPCDPHEVDPDQLPDASSSAHVVLRTKAFPFFVAGQSGADHLAFFRCISCRYTFGTDVQVPQELGAPGRVFLTGRPEALGNVGAMKREEFHRSDHAKTCSVQSCLLLPVYHPDMPRRCVGVVEVLTNNTELAYTRMCAMISEQLAKYGLATCPLSAVEEEGAGEISPSLKQVEVSPMVFQSGEGSYGRGHGYRETGLNGVSPGVHKEQDRRHEVRQEHEAGDVQDQERGGFVSRRDSVRLGMTLADLKSLMRQKKIKTLSRNSMGRYEEEVDLVLNMPVGLPRKVPSEIGIDSRWDAARRLPQKRHAETKPAELQEKQAARKPRRAPTPADFMYGGFPVVRQPNGKLVADHQMIARQQKGKNGEKSAKGVKSSNDATRVAQLDSNIQKQPCANGKAPAHPGDAGLLELDDRAGSGGFGSGALSAGDSDDWLGMIDPHMLDLMVNDNVLDAVGKMDDIELF